MKNIFLAAIFFLSLTSFSQNNPDEKSEYLTVRVQYGKTMSGYVYELFVDIGTNGAHSLSGNVTNVDDKVIISDDDGKYVFESDMDLLNYFGKKGWVIIQTGEIKLMDQHYNTYLLERRYIK